MATGNSSGPVIANCGFMKAYWTITTYPTYVNLQIRFDTLFINSTSSRGSWPASWSGYWGNGSNAVYRDIPPNGITTVVSGGYNIPRTSANQTVSFYAQCGFWFGTTYHTASFTIPAMVTAPGAPTASPADQITASSFRAHFAPGATGGSPITEYYLQISSDPLFPAEKTWRHPTTLATSYVISGLPSRSTYYYRVYAVNAVDSGPWSNVQSVSTAGVPDAPAFSPGTVTSMAIGGAVVDPPYVGSGITARYTQLSLSNTFTSILQDSPMHTPEFTGLTRATKYWVRSQVQNEFGWSPWSVPIEISTLATAPSAPAGYSATDIASTTAYHTFPSVSDTGGSTLIGMRAQVNTVALEVGSTTYTEDGYRAILFQGLTPATTHYFRLSVQNSGAGGGWSAWGPWVSFVTRGDVPTEPRDLDAIFVSETVISAEWLAPLDMLGSSLIGYQIRFALNKSFSQGLKTFTSLTPDYGFTGLQPGTKYFVQVRANSSNGVGSWSSILEVTTDGVAPSAQAMWQRIAGVWRSGVLWMKVAGTWRSGSLWQNIGGTWRKF